MESTIFWDMTPCILVKVYGLSSIIVIARVMQLCLNLLVRCLTQSSILDMEAIR